MGGDIDSFGDLWTSAETLYNWLFSQIQNIYSMLITNWIFNVIFFLLIFSLVIGFFVRLVKGGSGSSGSDNK